MRFAYEELSDDQFENLIVFVCQELLGLSTQCFSTGPDGGRDAKFVGKAQHIPSRTEPWDGTVIIQAKHTNGQNRHFSESDFYSDNSTVVTVLSEELLRINKLRATGQLDYYMLFANRRLAGNAESEIRTYIATKCGLEEKSIHLCGVEQLEMYLKRFPAAAEMAGIDPVDSPLIVSPDDLSEVVMALAKHVKTVRQVVDTPPTARTPYDTKNSLNNMTAEYAKRQRLNYLKDTAQIQKFLAAPENETLQQTYEVVVEEFNFKIIAKRQDYQTFDGVMEYLIDLLFNRDVILRRNKKLTRAMLFYMYWNCDLGVSEDA
jgi:hypothetical protein